MKENIERASGHILIIFGASGDLTRRKLIPALFNLFLKDLLPEKFAVLGVSRTEISDDVFRTKMSEGIKVHSDAEYEEEKLDNFLRKLYYTPIDTSYGDDYVKIKDRLHKLNNDLNTGSNYIFYLSTPPSLYPIIPMYLSKQDLNKSGTGFRRLIIEKPFGYDLKTAAELNNKLLEYFSEDQLYRIDHYLGKETVQNVLVTRFSNGIFEPLWNSKYVHHVEITSAESIGVENRGGYFEGSGTLRDMIQNHLMQMVGLVAMEPPSSFDSNAIRNETMKVFQSLRKLSPEDVLKNVIRGQYINSSVRGEKMKGYREEKDVDPNSRTETFVALKFYIDNWRWGGVPFYIRSGKRLPTRVTEIVIHFNKTPHWLFGHYQTAAEANNQLVIRIQPDEGMLLKFAMKVPGQGFQVHNVNMDFHYSDLKNTYVPDAYERLLLDCMLGDPTLYTRGDAVEELWKFMGPIQEAWEKNSDIPLYGYPSGSWGPDVADNIVEGEQLTWRYPCKNLSDDGLYCEL
ncbi:MAG: glucose-6-phosphate dehydrogenase [Ignavibacteriae bacterium HGW-Ignavibacteriae-2]|jgi:glucose-6-phosphate 1-dehydrogenase|nr:MAG: glucose-6-phosphate dehydrogenase [Ignavibacteriae bacterium HGW-Ignavibacteriae-2]